VSGSDIIGSSETARKRLTRAQAAVHRIAEGEKDEVQDESEDE